MTTNQKKRGRPVTVKHIQVHNYCHCGGDVSQFDGAISHKQLRKLKAKKDGNTYCYGVFTDCAGTCNDEMNY